MNNAVFALEWFADVFEDALPLLRAHYEEIEFYQDIEFSPRRDLYEMLDAAGKLRIYTVRVDRELVGYAVVCVDLSVHSGKSLQAPEDSLYLRPDMRGRMIGIRFIRWCDEQLRAEGVQVVFRNVQIGHPMLGRIVEKVGYQAQATIYSRRLD